MSEDTKKKREKPLRPDYRTKPAWSYREAQDYTNFSLSHLRKLIWQGKVKRANKRGHFIVDAVSLLKYLKGDDE